MDTVTIAHAKEHLEELIERARRGEDVRIVGDKGAAVRLTPLPGQTPGHGNRVPGRWRDRLPAPPAGFFDPLTDDELRAWCGDEP